MKPPWSLHYQRVFVNKKKQRASQRYYFPLLLYKFPSLIHFSGLSNVFEVSNDGLKSAKGEGYLMRQGKAGMWKKLGPEERLKGEKGDVWQKRAGGKGRQSYINILWNGITMKLSRWRKKSKSSGNAATQQLNLREIQHFSETVNNLSLDFIR